MREPTENSMAMQLTRRQQEILDFLHENARRFDHPPTLDELCAMLGLRSRGSLYKHIQALIQAGFVEPMAGQHRGVRLITDDSADDSNPFLGKIAGGRPIEALPQPEHIQVPPHLRTDKPCYVLQIVGDSMCEVGILDGDLVVISKGHKVFPDSFLRRIPCTDNASAISASAASIRTRSASSRAWR